MLLDRLSGADPRSEDAQRHCCGLGGREPVLDRLGPRCHRGGPDHRPKQEDADLGHDR